MYFVYKYIKAQPQCTFTFHEHVLGMTTHYRRAKFCKKCILNSFSSELRDDAIYFMGNLQKLPHSSSIFSDADFLITMYTIKYSQIITL
jgi:hypothetical protein